MIKAVVRRETKRNEGNRNKKNKKDALVSLKEKYKLSAIKLMISDLALGREEEEKEDEVIKKAGKVIAMK